MVASSTADRKQKRPPSSSSSSSSWRQEIESILQRLRRLSHAPSSLQQPQPQQLPPDSASAAMGTALAHRLMEGGLLQTEQRPRTESNDDSTTRTTALQEQAIVMADKIVVCLCEAAASPSVAHSFFHTLATATVWTQQQQQPTPHPYYPMVLLECMSRWIRLVEDLYMEQLSSSSTAAFGGVLETLSAVIASYAKCCASALQHAECGHENNDNDENDDDCRLPPVQVNMIQQSIANTFTSSRSTTPVCSIMAREFLVATTTSIRTRTFISLLTPLMAAGVLNLTTPLDVKMLFLRGLTKSVRGRVLHLTVGSIESSNNSDNHESSSLTLVLLQWLARSLHVFLNGCIPNCQTRPSSSETSSTVMANEVAYQWMVDLADMTATALLSLSANANQRGGERSAVANGGQEQQVMTASSLLTFIFEKLLPHFVLVGSGSCRFDMQPILSSLCDAALKIHNHAGNSTIQFAYSTWLKLGALALSTPLASDITGLLTLLNRLDMPSNKRENMAVQAILYSLGHIFVQHDEECIREQALHLLTRIESGSAAVTSDDGDNDIVPGKAAISNMTSTNDDTLMTTIFQLPFENSKDAESLLPFMTRSLTNIDPTTVSVLDQTLALLFGCSLLRYRAIGTDLTYAFLGALVQKFPHLGITLLPMLFQSIQTACDDANGTALLDRLHFVCDSVVKDPICAQGVWNLVGVAMIQPNSPTSVRSAAIRTFPTLCASNKKLYRRVVESLSRLVNSREAEIRLAVAATLSDLAREDRIRDVSDVIGWVQTYLTDENATVVHFAVLCLHHLVVARELDFPLVIKVLNKRLCPIDDSEKLLSLPDCVLEALVLLLGDGECDDSDSDDEHVVANSRKDILGVPPQVSASVCALILLSNSDTVPRTTSEEAVFHTRMNICRSLSRYSLHALGVDDEGVRSASVAQHKSSNEHVTETETGLRYIELKQIAAFEMQSPIPASIGLDTDPTVSLAKKLLSMEEESLGSSLWEKRGKRTPSKMNQASAPRSAFSVLPSSDQIQEMYLDEPSFSTSIASLLSYSGGSVDDLFDFASDTSGGLQGPISQVFNLQGWLRAMSMIWSGILQSSGSSTQEEVASVVEKVSGWQDLLDNVDSSYLALGTFFLYVPDFLSDPEGGSHGDFHQILERFRSDILQAYEGHQFESRDAANLSLGIAAARAIQSRASAFVERSIVVLEESISEHSGQASFGAYYGLALIAQIAGVSCSEADASLSSDHSQQLSWINHIASLIVSELHWCIEERVPAFVTLVACLKTGKPSLDLLSSLSGMDQDEQVISESNLQKASGLLLSLALCVQAVGAVNADLLLGVRLFIEKLPWGVGKGFVFPNVVVQSSSYEMDDAVSQLENLAEDLLGEGDTKCFTDVLYASIAMKAFLPSKAAQSVEFELVKQVVSTDSANISDGCLSSLALAATTLISTFPCLANGGRVFCSAPSLHPQVTKEIVSQVSSLLSDISKRSRGEKSARTAIQSLGLLASCKNGFPNVVPSSVFEVSSKTNPSGPQNPRRKEVSLERLPSPHEGTLLESVIESIRQEWERIYAASQVSPRRLNRLLACLETLSLPSEFARSFIEPMLDSHVSELKPGCIALLVSQVSGRRRAAFDGKDYLRLVNRLALLPSASFQATMGIGSVSFLRSVHSFLPKLPSDNVEAVLVNLWEICEEEVTATKSASYAVAYLHSVSLLLETKQTKETSRLSPRTYTTIAQILLQTVVPTLFSSREETLATGHAIERSVLDCLSSLEFSGLEENQFFVLSGGIEQHDTNLSKAFCIVGLAGRHNFDSDERAAKGLLKVVAWFANQNDFTTSGTALRELAFRISVATRVASSESKKDIMSLLFEALHVHGPQRSFELLSMLAAIWSSGLGFDPESSSAGPFLDGADEDSQLQPATLSKVSHLLFKDMPFDLGAYGRSAKLQGLIANAVARIYKAWKEQSVEQKDIDALEGILICCRTLDNAKESELVSLMTRTLTTQPNTLSTE